MALLLRWRRLLPVWLLACVGAAAQAAGGCSPYVGAMVINEVRIGKSNGTDVKNQLELYNVGGVAEAVWRTWTIVAYGGDNLAKATRKGSYAMASGFTANGPFIYNNVTKMWARNGVSGGLPRASDFAVFDANMDLVAYIAIGVGAQATPACYGSRTTISSNAGGDNTGDVMRIPDGGSWPGSVTKTSVHTIGRTNQCSPSGDIVINESVNYDKPVQNSTTVVFTVTIYNNACGTNVSGNEVTITNLSTANFSSRTISVSGGGGSASGTGNIVWNVGTVNAGVTYTLTFTGKAINAGALTSVATLTKPTSGLVNTGDDSDSAAITVYPFNYVGFAVGSDTLTEGTDTAYAAEVTLNVPASDAVTVNYSVSGTAGATDTNLPASGSISIAAGSTSGSIDFSITNDSTHEATKNLVLTITSVSSSDPLVRIGSGATGDMLAETITLLDDDPLVVHHYELSLPSTGVSCSASSVTVTACADASSPCTNAATNVAGVTATLAASSGTLGSTSLTFNASGVASTTLAWPAAADGATSTVSLSGESISAASPRRCCADGTACAAAGACSISFATAGFIISATQGGSGATVPTQVAGANSGIYQLRAVRTNTTTKACEAALAGASMVNWAFQCIDPSTCSAGNLLTLSGSSAASIAGNPAGSVSSYTGVPMSFDADGNAAFSFAYADVGQGRLWVGKTVGGAPLAGSSNVFVTRPASFSVTNLRQTASPNLANPAAGGAAGAKFVKAGESFSATVTALTAGGVATPNYGRESSPEGVRLTAALVQPAGGSAGTLANGTLAGGSFSGGVASLTSLSYSEVGIITLTPEVADGDYLGAGNVSAAASANIGRFVPAQFAVSARSVTHRAALACTPASGFSYLDENFRLGFTLTALNLSGSTTRNYTGAFAKLDPTQASGWNLAGIDGGTVFTLANARLALGSATGAWSNGVASGISLTANVARASAPDGPFDAGFGIAPTDSDGVTIGAYDLASTPAGSSDRASLGTVALRFGRLRLANAIGAQSRPLALALTAQYWTGSAFGTNTLDNCTTIPSTAVSLGNLRKTLTAGDAAVSGASVRLSGGAGLLTLAAPAAGHSGTLDVVLSLGSSAAGASCLQGWVAASPATSGANLGHLRGAWCGGTQSKDPAARASFGLYGGHDAVLYQRENF